MSLENILLGFLREPASGYDLKSVFTGSARHFWAADLSQTYTTLRRMERQGLIKSKVVPSTKGPDRRVYSLSAAGRKTLDTWLTSEPGSTDVRSANLAQLFFMANLDDFERTLAFVEALRGKHTEQLQTLRRIEREWLREIGKSTDNLSNDEFHRYLTLRSGIHSMQARVKWCNEAMNLIRARVAGIRPKKETKEPRSVK